ncbi:histidine--tRNA ligase [Boudabousia tangfeifanii]|uniref:Histidine--tRNA ligase n=1 Tax=Boudabousia tangfeifanii TaxID=1912795 RepID=A0A1D9MK17_9ACTO|nr:histidine--tRNA ligase [Boudabousia tangfeifanii]AOZ72647.1 histidine--tRNA ligase [Boudabousia tangfeifanii]
MAKNNNTISGFPEWLPQGRLIEKFMLQTLEEVFALHGFQGIETRAVEPVSRLLSKGETSKEIYLLSRLAARNSNETESDPNKQLGLHFDLTVPLARYVEENAGHLTFPFKRFQIQKVWRGERPQEGRFREFVQADIDVVGQETLPFHHEVELPLVMGEVFARLGLPPVVICANNRKLLQGVCEQAGISQIEDALRGLDKLDKIGPELVKEELLKAGISAEGADLLLAVAKISTSDPQELRSQIDALGLSGELLETGLNELCELLTEGERQAPGLLRAELKISRGLDYYTGTVYESFIQGHEDLGAICSGGRYDNLVSVGNKKYPGVGMSLGLTRLLSRIFAANLLSVSRPTPTAVLVAVNNEDSRGESLAVAQALRARGIATEVAERPLKFGKQIKYADRRGIPFVWFINEDGHEVKDIRSGEQVPADPAEWLPPTEDLFPQVFPAQANN